MRVKRTDEESLSKLVEGKVVSRILHPLPKRKDDLIRELLLHRAELELQNETLRQAQAELMECERRYSALFENGAVAQLVLDTSTQIRFANLRARELLGRAVIGSRLSRFLIADEAIPFERFRRKVLDSLDRCTSMFTFVDGKGHRRELRIEGLRDPQCDEWAASLTDVTILNAAVRRLRHTERLESVGEHASGVAHDLKNLLCSVAMRTELALNSVTDEDAVRQSLGELREVLERCMSTAEQLTSFSRSEPEPPPVVDLNEGISAKRSLLRSLLGDDVELHLDSAAWDPFVRMAEPHIEQVLLNAACNARHAMPRGGTLRIATANVVFESNACEGRAEFARCVRWTISDTGVGMAEDVKRRAFAPFFTTKPPGSGTGLGLSLIKAVIERAGGSALLDSEVGRGTSLVIDLPCASASSSTSSRPPPPSRRRQVV